GLAHAVGDQQEAVAFPHSADLHIRLDHGIGPERLYEVARLLLHMIAADAHHLALDDVIGTAVAGPDECITLIPDYEGGHRRRDDLVRAETAGAAQAELVRMLHGAQHRLQAFLKALIAVDLAQCFDQQPARIFALLVATDAIRDAEDLAGIERHP